MTPQTTIEISQERALLDAARHGDEDAFGRLVEPHRRELHAHCYRMLGSLHDAEDALQDALLRAWRGLPGFEGRSSLRSWLYRLATNTSLDLIARRPKRVLPIDYGPSADPHGDFGAPLVETAWIGPYPDAELGSLEAVAAPEARYEVRESVELAFVAALQHLPARQRATLILREVLGFSAKETAATLGSTVASVNSALQRARTAVAERLPEQSQQATLRSLGDQRMREIVEAYTEALEQADVDALLALLTEDATWSMPPYAIWYAGYDAIREFLQQGPLTVRWRHLAASANGQPAVGCYVFNEESGTYRAQVLDVLTLDGEQIAEVTAFIDSGLFARFGLPEELPDRPARRKDRRR